MKKRNLVVERMQGVNTVGANREGQISLRQCVIEGYRPLR